MRRDENVELRHESVSFQNKQEAPLCVCVWRGGGHVASTGVQVRKARGAPTTGDALWAAAFCPGHPQCVPMMARRGEEPVSRGPNSG